MNQDIQSNRLSNIVTDWDGIREAHREGIGNDEIAAARNRILMRYAGCIRTYIFGATKNHEVAEDLSQEFALRFVRGDYKNAAPEKGRFRDYLKASLRNLIVDHFRNKQPAGLTTTAVEMIVDVNSKHPFDGLEIEFQQNWRKQVLSLVWDELEQFEIQGNNRYFSVLRFRAQNPDSSSLEMATDLSKTLGKVVSAEWVRQTIHRASKKFAGLLIAEVRNSVSTLDEDEIQQELAELGLQKYI